MRFRPISLLCECGGRLPARIARVGLTPEHQLVIRWGCPACKRKHHTIRALTECWRDCTARAPEGEEVETVEVRAKGMRDPDAEFLHSLGVRFPNEEEEA